LKVLYLNFLRQTNTGVGKKTIAQIKGLRANEVEVVEVLASQLLEGCQQLRSRRLMTTYKLRKSVISLCFEKIRTEHPEVVYCRFPGSDFSFYYFVSRSPIPVITEHNTVEILERRQHRDLRYFSELFLGKAVRKKIDGFVGVTREITEHQQQRAGGTKISLVNGNGIDVNSVPLRTPPVFDGKNLDLLCVAQVAKWHGLDRLIRGIADYKGSVNVILHIVGDGSEVPNLKKLVWDLRIDDSVFFYGFKTDKELSEFFDKCHIAIGSLGIHRKGLTETSELKVREYCARGIPFVCSVPDSDFAEEFPYTLRVLSSEETIDIAALISFAEKICSDNTHSQRMREYAADNLCWSTKMTKVIEFCDRVLKIHSDEK